MTGRARSGVAVGLAVVLAGCSGSSQPSAPSPASTVTAGASSVPFVIELPIAAGDGATYAYGIWPYGVHGGGHAVDGHGGFDIEYRVGAPVLAVTDGVVDSVTADAHDPSRRVVHLKHARDRGQYLTDYSNLVAVPDRLVPGAVVARGDTLGTAGAFADNRSAMIHFQLGDPTHLENGQVIASPANYVSASAKALLDDLWRTAAYRAEICEPFLTNSRAQSFPIARTWTRQSGSGPSTIELTCVSDSDVTYVMTNGDGAAESGTVVVGWNLRPMTLDFRSSSGSSRLAIYDIVSETMRLALGGPGAPRPASLDAASVYTTRP
jgi:peptidase M23-like protein